MIYVAAPYSHPDPVKVHRRMGTFADVVSLMIKERKHPVSPLMNHFLVYHTEVDFPLTWEYWEEYSLKLLKNCKEMYVVCMDGWKESTGVTAEIKLATELNIPINYIEVENDY